MTVIDQRIDPLDRLPHRGLMMLVDRVVSLSADRVVGELDVRDDAFWAAGHFPGDPILPGVLQIEFAAQLSGIVLGYGDGTSDGNRNDAGGSWALGALARVRSATFRTVVRPPDVLRGAARLEERRGRLANFAFRLTSGRSVVADGRLGIAMS